MTTSVLISNVAIYLTSSFIYLVLNYSPLPTEGRGKGGRRYLREVTHYVPWLHLSLSSLTSCTFHPYMVSGLSPAIPLSSPLPVVMVCMMGWLVFGCGLVLGGDEPV